MKEPLKKILILILLLVTACTAKDSSNPVELKPTVFVSILPLKFFADRICGDLIDVEVMLPAGKSPATYEVLPGQLIKLARAKLFFTIGVPFEEVFLKRLVQNESGLKVVDAARGIVKLPLAEHTHADAAESDNEHKQRHSLDPHVWMSPRLAVTISETMLEEIIALDKKNKESYLHNFQVLKMQLRNVDLKIRADLQDLAGTSMLVFHPAFGYFAREYKLKQFAIELDGKEVTAANLVKTIERAKAEKVRLIFVQPEFSKKSADLVARAIGGRTIVAASLEYNYIKNLEQISEQLKDKK